MLEDILCKNTVSLSSPICLLSKWITFEKWLIHGNCRSLLGKYRPWNAINLQRAANHSASIRTTATQAHHLNARAAATQKSTTISMWCCHFSCTIGNYSKPRHFCEQAAPAGRDHRFNPLQIRASLVINGGLEASTDRRTVVLVTWRRWSVVGHTS